MKKKHQLHRLLKCCPCSCSICRTPEAQNRRQLENKSDSGGDNKQLIEEVL